MAHLPYNSFRVSLAWKYPDCGHALWEPSPGGLYDSVEVGDVGFICKGRFHRLFNVLLPGDHPSHQNFGVPESHQQLRLNVPTCIYKGIEGTKDFYSRHISLSRESDVYASGPDDDSHITVSCPGKRGAVLSLPVPAQREDTIVVRDFGRWIVKNINDWFAFTKKLGLGINRMQDIILVTGRHCAKSWVNAAFSEGPRDAEVSFGVRVSGVSGVNVEQRRARGDVVLKLGPNGESLPENQCIFVRGFRVARVLNIWPRLRGEAGPAPDIGDHEPESDKQIESTGTSAHTNYRDPLDVLLQYIVKNAPDCNMALVHDDDLTCVSDASLDSLQPDVLMGHLQDSAPEIQWDLIEFGADVGSAKIASLSMGPCSIGLPTTITNRSPDQGPAHSPGYRRRRALSEPSFSRQWANFPSREESQTVTAVQSLKATHGVDDLVQVVDNQEVDTNDKVQATDDQEHRVDDKVQGVKGRMEDVNINVDIDDQAFTSRSIPAGVYDPAPQQMGPPLGNNYNRQVFGPATSRSMPAGGCDSVPQMGPPLGDNSNRQGFGPTTSRSMPAGGYDSIPQQMGPPLGNRQGFEPTTSRSMPSGGYDSVPQQMGPPRGNNYNRQSSGPSTSRSMTTSMDEDVRVGVIGGSGLYHLDNLTFIKNVNPDTPWGYPSSPIAIASLPTGTRIAFLARHGPGHTISPSAVPARANIAALKSLGVRTILAFSAVGSLREDIPPGTFALPTQIIDCTKGVRPASFFEGTTVVAHAAFGDPFSRRLVQWLVGPIKQALADEGRGVKLVTDKCIVCTEGPQFATRAESLVYRQWGGDLINMSVLPEARLAREAEISYALIATVTDYDSWRPNTEAVTAAEVFKTLRENAETSRHVAATILQELHATVLQGDILSEEAGSMQSSIVPCSAQQTQADRDKLCHVLPDYFSE